MSGNTEQKPRKTIARQTKCLHQIPMNRMWRKTGDVEESSIYELLGSHPRILPYYGVDTHTNDLLLLRLDNGDLWTHLVVHRNIPLNARITWAIEIAQGLARLHAKKVVWADAHLRNILLTDDFHVVLCDFGFSILDPSYFHSFSTAPPPVFLYPPGYYGKPPTRVDVFGFGIILYVLLENRFPFCRDVRPYMEEQRTAYQNHCDQTFDTLTDASLNSCFGCILANCFTALYTSGEELVKALEGAYESWTNEHRELDTKGDNASDIPYPEKPEFIEIEPVPPMHMFPNDECSGDTMRYDGDTGESITSEGKLVKSTDTD